MIFVRSGLVNPYGPYLYYTGDGGYYWSSAPNSDGVNGYYLNFNNSGVYPSSNTNRLNGFSLRCLAR